ncbi:MAG: acyltransferase [Clostridium sp.]|uniref:acyltransferase n=1 Tax=Clostridium sp. TaxID=1506 RepID=UPI003EE72BEB
MRREQNMDLLKVICCFLVVIVHSVAPYLLKGISMGRTNLNVTIPISIIGRIAVPIFVMISGGFLIKKYKSKKEFYKRRLPRAIGAIIFWNIAYSLFRIGLDPSFNIGTLWKEIFMGGASIHLWYLYLLVLLYILTPFIVDIKNKISNKGFRNLSIIILILGVICEFARMKIGFLNIPLYYPVEFLGYFLIGKVIKDKKIENSKCFLILFITALVVGAGLSIYFKNLENPIFMYFHTSLNPPVLIGSISLYTFFCNMSIRECILIKIAKYTFGIYGLHFMIVLILGNILAIENVLIGTLVIAIASFLISLIICIVLYKIKKIRKIIF